MLEVLSVLEHDPVVLALVAGVRVAGERERELLGVVNFPLAFLEGGEDVLELYGEEKALRRVLLQVLANDR